MNAISAINAAARGQRFGTFSCARGEGCDCQFSDQPILEVMDREFGAMQVVRCEACGLGVTLPQISDVAKLYEGRETQDYQPNDASLATKIKQFFFRRQTRKMLSQASFAGGQIVDYGCGSGLYTSCIAHSAPSNSQVTGMDFFAEPPAQIGGAQYRSFADADELAGIADLVTCFHVLEHDPDPLALIGKLRKLAKPGATFVIEVPNIDCPWRYVFGRNWDNWYLPFHRTHFSRASLHNVVALAGLTVLDEHSVHIPAIGRSLANMLGTSNSLPFVLASAAGFPVQVGLENLYDGPSALRIVARAP